MLVNLGVPYTLNVDVKFFQHMAKSEMVTAVASTAPRSLSILMPQHMPWQRLD
jgi:hypothetical protein